MPAPMLLLLTVLLGAPLSARADDLIVLLEARSCPNCELTDADLVHADLRNADLKAADLQRANLSSARLDGADLRDADLRFSNLQGASLRGVDLRQSNLYGADLRQADLTGARLDNGGLEQSFWQGASGIKHESLSHASLHNAGVSLANQNQWQQAEFFFSAAITTNPREPLSWIGRGLCRGELGRITSASEDLARAGQLFHQQGDTEKSSQLFEASRKVITPNQEDLSDHGNGIGNQVLSGALAAIQSFGPIVLRAFLPLTP